MYRINLKEPIDTVMFGRMQQSMGWGHPGRQLDCHLIVLIIGGSAEFNINNIRHIATRGDCVFIPMNTYYTAHTEDFCEYYFFHFNSAVDKLKKEEAALVSTPGSDPRLYTFALPPTDFSCISLSEKMDISDFYDDIINMLMKCQSLRAGMNPVKKLLFNLQFIELLARVGSSADPEENSSHLPLSLEKITTYIQKHYTEPLSLDGFSEHFRLSKPYIARLFREHLNTTATAYINNLRLDHGAELLLSSNMNVTEIAAYVGFSDCYYFSRLFKKRFLESPLNYAKRQGIHHR